MRVPLSAFLTLSLAGLQLIAIIFVVTSSYLTSERALLSHARDLLSDVAANTIEHSRGFLQPARAAAELATRLAENEIVSSDNQAVLEKLLYQQLQLAPQFSGIFYGDEAGNFVYVMRSDRGEGLFRTKTITHSAEGRAVDLVWRTGDFAMVDSGTDPTDTYDPRVRPWYARAKETGTSVWTDPYIFFTSQKPGITVSSPVVDAAGGLAGVVGVDIEIDSISDFLSHLRIGKGGMAFILNQNGDVIAHPRQDLIIQENHDGTLSFRRIDEIEDPVARAAFDALGGDLSVEAETTTVFDHAGARFVATLTPAMSDVLPWTIGVIAPEDDFIGTIKENRTQNTLLAILAAALTGAVGLLIARSINRPIRLLADRATRISQGDYQMQGGFPNTYGELVQANATMTEEAMRRKRFEDQYSVMFEMATRGMAEIEPSTGRLQRVNTRFGEIMGYSESTLLKRSVDELFGLDAAKVFGLVADADTSETFPLERQCVAGNGQAIWLSLNAIVLRDDNGHARHAVLTIDDITKAKAAEAQIRKLSLELAHNTRLNMMGQMAAGLAHELNQPLTSITQNAESALATVRQAPDDPELPQILTEIDQQAFRAAEIIRALRGFVRKDDDMSKPFDLGALIDQTISLVAAEAREQGVTITRDLPDLPLVIGSRVQIAQVLVNLLRNAIEALSGFDRARRTVSVSVRCDGPQVEVSVADEGPGVDPGITLFERFETTKSAGMGLGLSICRTIIEQHGGKLWYEPAAIGGRFLFTLRQGGADA